PIGRLPYRFDRCVGSPEVYACTPRIKHLGRVLDCEDFRLPPSQDVRPRVRAGFASSRPRSTRGLPFRRSIRGGANPPYQPLPAAEAIQVLAGDRYSCKLQIHKQLILVIVEVFEVTEQQGYQGFALRNEYRGDPAGKVRVGGVRKAPLDMFGERANRPLRLG